MLKQCSFILFASVISTALSRDYEVRQNAPPGESYTRLCIPSWALNRKYTAATNAPIATALQSDPARKGTDEELSILLKYAESEFQRKVRNMHL